jgi:hypothetical protein
LIIILQDPIERLIQHYFAAQRMGLPISFQQWVEKDLRILNHTGLLNTRQEFHGSPEEDVARYEYTSSTSEGAVGRSMYEIQLRQWFQAILAISRNPRRTALLIRAKDFVKEPAGYYRRILRFVGVNDTLAYDSFQQNV